MTAQYAITPDTRILDAVGRDWAWAFVVFRDVPGWSGYRVGSDGSLWSRRPGRSRRPVFWRRIGTGHKATGHYQASLVRSGGHRRCAGVHALVLEAFVGPCPPGMEACHFPNSNPVDNRPINLRWDTPKANARDREIHGHTRRGSRNGFAKLNEDQVARIKERLAIGVVKRHLAREFGVSPSLINFIESGAYWRHV
jgi:hypothetical protein